MDIIRNKKIVLIIGNGFDLDLGRKTSYRDFWNSDYCPKSYPAPLISHLNSKWSEESNDIKWYDLENELLNYYNKAYATGFQDLISKREQRFLAILKRAPTNNILHFQDYQDEISGLCNKGLISLDGGFSYFMTCNDLDELLLDQVSRDKKAFELIKRGLCNYLKEISSKDLEKDSIAVSVLYTLSDCCTEEYGNTLSVYNFNYTDLPYNYPSIVNPQYVHGKCENEKVIIGTKDYSEFNTDYDFLQKSFDPYFHTPPIVYDLLQADEVVFFGHSLGINDSQYFKPFFKQQTNIDHPIKKGITIFTRDENSVIEIKRSLQSMTNYNLSVLNSLNNLDIITTNHLGSDHTKYKSFLERFLEDTNKVRALIGKLQQPEYQAEQ